MPCMVEREWNGKSTKESFRFGYGWMHVSNQNVLLIDDGEHHWKNVFLFSCAPKKNIYGIIFAFAATVQASNDIKNNRNKNDLNWT